MPMAAPISPFSSERRKSWRPARSVSVGVSGRTSRHISWATHQPAVRNRNCNQTGDYCEQRRGIGASRRGHSARRRGIIASRDGGLLRSYEILLQEDGWFFLADWGYSEQTGVKKYWLCCASRRLSMSNRFAVCLQAARLLHKLLNQTAQILIINDFRLVQASRPRADLERCWDLKPVTGHFFLPIKNAFDAMT